VREREKEREKRRKRKGEREEGKDKGNFITKGVPLTANTRMIGTICYL
jgi:hypothetical protein